MYVHHLEIRYRPAQAYVGDHIAFRTCLGGADQADAMREFRKRHFAVDIKQAFAFELFAQLVDHRLQTAACTGCDDCVTSERKRRAFHPQIRLAVDDYTIALHKRRGGRRELAEAIDFHRDVLIIVAQGEIGAARTAGVDLCDLPGHPYGRPTLDGHMEFLAEHTYRPRIIRCGFAGKAGKLFRLFEARLWLRLRCHGVVSRSPSHVVKIPPSCGQ